MISGKRIFVLLSFVALTAAIGNTTHAAVSALWPAAPSRLHLDTPYGELGVSSSDYVYESHLTFNGQKTTPNITGKLNIPYAFSTQKFHIALISINSGRKSCPVVYTWVVLNNDGYHLSPEFGSCSEQIRVSAKGSTFIVETPDTKEPEKVNTYVYDGKSVRLLLPH